MSCFSIIYNFFLFKLDLKNLLLLRVNLNILLLFEHNYLSLRLPRLRYILNTKLIC